MEDFGKVNLNKKDKFNDDSSLFVQGPSLEIQNQDASKYNRRSTMAIKKKPKATQSMTLSTLSSKKSEKSLLKE